jgi:hypothetical protein
LIGGIAAKVERNGQWAIGKPQKLSTEEEYKYSTPGDKRLAYRQAGRKSNTKYSSPGEKREKEKYRIPLI